MNELQTNARKQMDKMFNNECFGKEKAAASMYIKSAITEKTLKKNSKLYLWAKEIIDNLDYTAQVINLYGEIHPINTTSYAYKITQNNGVITLTVAQLYNLEWSKVKHDRIYGA